MESRLYNADMADKGIWYLGLPAPYAYLPPDSIALSNEVKTFQSLHRLKTDGKLGKETYAKMIAVLGAPAHNVDGVYIGSTFEPFTGCQTFTYKEDASLRLRCHPRKKPADLIVLHYDVTYNARSTHAVLKKRGYSSHFCINHNGDLYQYADPEDDVTYHAGDFNKRSVGIDINNPADPAYIDTDAKKRLGVKRTIIEQKIHGAAVKRLSYFPEQIETLRRLLTLLHDKLGIPLVYPTDVEGNPLTEVLDGIKDFSGVVGHYHLSRKKTDPAPLDWNKVFHGIQDEITKEILHEVKYDVEKEKITHETKYEIE